MDGIAESLARSLLHEGYALYPYTPGAAKNSTPTPFGIVYPPDYAAQLASTFDHARIECVLEAPADTVIEARVLFLQPSGERHEAAERKLEINPAELSSMPAAASEASFEAEGVRARLRVEAQPLGDRLHRVAMQIANETPVSADELAVMDRPAAMLRALISCQLLLATSAGRFISPLLREGELGDAVSECTNTNTWPVLASAGDDVVLGAPIFLPDHPRIAPESRVNLFDNTEIEEALLLHVHALSDDERAELDAGDPVVREMVEKAAATTPDEIMALHGRLEDVTPAVPEFTEPAKGHPHPGEERITVDGRVIGKGSEVVLRPSDESDVYDRMLAGRTATVERIYYDYDGEVHIGVTINNDPSQELYRETGRYHFFKTSEVEVVGG